MITGQTSWSIDPYDRLDAESHLIYCVTEDKDGNVVERFIVATWSDKYNDWRLTDDEDGPECPPGVRFEGAIIKAVAWLRLPTLPIQAMNVASEIRGRVNKIHAQPERNDNAEDYIDATEEEIDFEDFGDN